MCRALSVIMMAGLLACGQETGPEIVHLRVAGTYAGFFEGSNQFEHVEGTLRITLTQDEEKLNGSWEFSGVVTGGVIPGPVSASGSLVGVIEIKGTGGMTLSLFEVHCLGEALTMLAESFPESGAVMAYSAGIRVCADPAAGITIDRSFNLNGDAVLARQ